MKILPNIFLIFTSTHKQRQKNQNSDMKIVIEETLVISESAILYHLVMHINVGETFSLSNLIHSWSLWAG